MATSLSPVELDRGPDVVPVEAALEVIIDDLPFAVLMRTPTGDDLALVAGFLWSEGVIADPDDLAALAPCRDPANPRREHRVLVRLAAGVRPPSARPVVTSSACGLCGTANIDDIVKVLSDRGGRTARHAPPRPLEAGEIVALAERARPRQALFEATGAVHGAALFDGVELVDLREDVGRHNAVDKLLGQAFLERRALPDLTLWVSGRVAFEIVQKAAIAGLRGVVGVGGTTSLAVELARRVGLPLVAFVRGERFNRYAP